MKVLIQQMDIQCFLKVAFVGQEKHIPPIPLNSRLEQSATDINPGWLPVAHYLGARGFILLLRIRHSYFYIVESL